MTYKTADDAEDTVEEQADGGETGQQVRELVVNLEKELQVWRTRIREVLQDTIMAQDSQNVKRGAVMGKEDVQG